jgi:hypothetical protein
MYDASTVHADEQPSPSIRLPSSHASRASLKLSPQVLFTATLHARLKPPYTGIYDGDPYAVSVIMT